MSTVSSSDSSSTDLSAVEQEIAATNSANLTASLSNSVESNVSDVKSSEALWNEWARTDTADGDRQAEVTTDTMNGFTRIDFDSQDDERAYGGVAYATPSTGQPPAETTTIGQLLGYDLIEA